MHGLHDAAMERIGDVDRSMHALHDVAMERIGEVDQHMRVLHETAMVTIRGIAEHDLVTQPELDRRFAESDERFERRIPPLEDAVRTLSRSEPSGE
jgi:hypothetical protein